MKTVTEFPHAPRPPEPRGTHVEPPWVPVESRWEYKDLVRETVASDLPSEAELNVLGSEGWELTGTVREDQRVHFYFKRERLR